MTIHHLIIYKTVCEEMSITKAAKRLFMTQPAVSHVIADLEKEAGTPLFDRSSQRIFLNERGRVLLEKAARLLELYKEMEEDLETLESRALLKIGSSITIANFWLPAFAKKFEANHKETPLQITVDSAANTAAKLAGGEIDIALLEGSAYMDRFECVPFASYELIPLCAPEYLAKMEKEQKQSLEIEEFASMRLLLREKGSAIRDVLEGAFLQKELPLKPYWTSVNSQALIRAAQAGLGVTLLPDIMAVREIKDGTLVKVAVKDLYLTNKNYIAFYKSKYITAPMKAFLEIAVT